MFYIPKLHISFIYKTSKILSTQLLRAQLSASYLDFFAEIRAREEQVVFMQDNAPWHGLKIVLKVNGDLDGLMKPFRRFASMHSRSYFRADGRMSAISSENTMEY